MPEGAALDRLWLGRVDGGSGATHGFLILKHELGGAGHGAQPNLRPSGHAEIASRIAVPVHILTYVLEPHAHHVR